jgi:hypothetical protein
MAVCNEGQYLGTVGACVVIESPEGTECDDGLFCTTQDACDGKGTCVGGPPNDCGMTAPPCSVMLCDETFQTCDPIPADDGTACTPTDLCQVNGACKAGECVGAPKDCTFSPLTECNSVACNPATGKCEGTPDTSKNGKPCSLFGNLCNLGRSCNNGACEGGVPKDCSALTSGCTNGLCDPMSGDCYGETVPVGGACIAGVGPCQVGECDANNTCQPKNVADGTPCNDDDICTQSDTCTSGVCAGTPTVGCNIYLSSNFESCPDGWTLTGDWQCGKPTSVGPKAAHGGQHVLATQLAGNYNNSQDYATTYADSAPIDLTTATSPKLSFWTWFNTEGSTDDGFNLEISVDGGPFSTVTSVTPNYSLTVGGQSAWGGDQSAKGWQNYLADLSSYAGHSVVLRFGFRSDSSVTKPGVYIDDLLVAEPNAIQLAITTTTVPNAVADNPYVATLARSGGSASAAWSIVGGSNYGWLTIDSSTGKLSGNPTTADVGPVTVTVRVEELSVPDNYATQTYTLSVAKALYFQSFEGACPNGWTLGGDWQCGVPTSGPSAAHSGTQALATQLAGNYNASQSYTTAIATSPSIDLTNAVAPTLSFWAWVYTEGSSYDGFNLKVSTDGGMTYTLVTTVTPAYSLTVSSEQAWGGNQSSAGWQNYSANLAAYAGKQIMLRFAFRSDSSGQYPGVYIDDFMVAGQ